MSSKFNRRDFLKLAGALPLWVSVSNLAKSLRLRADERKNVIIIVFDAFSAYNISLYGYNRETTPNINKLAERATVYHNHFAGSNFTTSGTATLLTGTLPWTNRALEQNGTVSEAFVHRSFFSVFKDHYRAAYSHNEWANTLLAQFDGYIEELVPKLRLFLRSSDDVIQNLFKHDKDISSVSWVRNMKIKHEGYAYSLFLSRLISAFDYQASAKYLPRFPRGLPTALADSGFLLEHAIDWIAERVTSIDEPLFGYFHLLPPHAPYNTAGEFAGLLRHDGYKAKAIQKPRDVFAVEAVNDLYVRRTYYDEFILYVDSEFGRLFKMFEDSGVLENSWVILTSDHGEIFERGISGHETNALYQPLIRVPLMIFEPGKSERRDIYTPTSAVDILPTMAFLNDLPIPGWAEGKVLPPYQTPDEQRSIYALRSHATEKDQPLIYASVTLIKGRYKLHYYTGYSQTEGKDLVRLFDIQSDPEEVNDLVESQKNIADEMLIELKAKLADVNKPYL